MILGASTTYKAGSKGGSASHTHSLSGTVGETTLTVEQLASHTHGYLRFSTERPNDADAGKYVGATPSATNATGGSQPHTHTLSGASGSANSLPPYYALAWIMRTA